MVGVSAGNVWRLGAEVSEGRKGRVLVMLALVAYLPAFAGGFVWDDWILVTEPLVRRLDGVASIWLSPSDIRYEGHYWPVVYTSFWLEHKLWGLHPTGYHAVNVALHALNSVLLWRLLVRLSVPGAWLAAAVFVVHPVHVESVAWIIERKDLLSALFYLGAVHAWLRFKEESSLWRWLLCLLLLLGALLSKSIAVTLPAALLLLQWWREGRVTWRDAGCILPLALAAAAVTVADVSFYRDRVESAFDYTYVERALIAARALWVYARQLVWPGSMPIFYPRWEVHSNDVVGWLALATALIIGAVLWLARGRMGRGPFVGALFFVLTLSPILGFVDFRFMDIAFVADRFQYLASIGPLAVLLAVGVHVSARMSPKGRAGGIVAAGVILVALSALTWRLSGIYRDDLTFARHAVEQNPRHHFGQILLSYALNAEHDHEGALAAAKRAVNLAEGSRGIDSAAAPLAMGRVLLTQDRPERAETQLRRALESSIRNRRAVVQLELARSLVSQTRYDEGLALYEELLAEYPGNDLAHLYRGRAFHGSGRYENAADALKSGLAVVRHPDTEPHLRAMLGESLRKQRRFHVAATQLDKALALNPNHIQTLVARHDLEVDWRRVADAGGRLEPRGLVTRGGEMGRGSAEAWLAAALDRCRELIAKKPDLALAHVLLGGVLLRMEEYETAAEALNGALTLVPSRPVAREAHRVLGEVREKQGRSEEAAAQYRSALDIYPFDAEALERLAGLHVREKRYRAALPLKQQLVKVTPFAAETHYELALTLYRVARHSDALRAVERALELAPGLEQARRLQELIREAGR